MYQKPDVAQVVNLRTQIDNLRYSRVQDHHNLIYRSRGKYGAGNDGEGAEGEGRPDF